MSFKQIQPRVYPPRLWQLVGYPGSGKSTFATQMRAPILPIDADHRWDEVLKFQPDSLELSAHPLDHVETHRIAARLQENMEGSGVGTIVVDSLTAIIAPLVVRAMQMKAAGEVKNQMAAFKDKALAMRELQDAVTRWGVDTLWIWHLQDARDEAAKEVVRATLSPTEVARLHRSVNVQLHIIDENGQRAIKVVWSRRGRAGLTLFDDSGKWEGMPEKLEAAMYDGLTLEDQTRIEQATPRAFASPDIAVAWALEQEGAFKAIAHAQNAFKKLLRENQPITMEQFAPLWVADVRRRQQQPGVFNGEHAEDEEGKP